MIASRTQVEHLLLYSVLDAIHGSIHTINRLIVPLSRLPEGINLSLVVYYVTNDFVALMGLIVISD